MACRVSMTGVSSAALSYVIRTVSPMEDAPKDYGSHKTLYNRFIRWSRVGVFAF
jgi:transposase